MVRVNLEVERTKKEKWKDYAEEHPEADGNLSAFIRACVEKEIAGNHSGDGVDSEEILQRLGELGDSITQVHDRMDSMETRLSGIESETTTQPEVEELKGDVFDLLPEKEPGSLEWQDRRNELNEQKGVVEEASEEFNAWKGTIEGIATAIDEPEYVVEKCIERLQESTQLIRTVEYGDETRYYKVI